MKFFNKMKIMWYQKGYEEGLKDGLNQGHEIIKNLLKEHQEKIDRLLAYEGGD